ncbi:MAG: hypothetical protein F6K41_19095 [Symploca sp. SIO3E6]|nr:hypothetical protein [Caldora sp. SIO3E6]
MLGSDEQAKPNVTASCWVEHFAVSSDNEWEVDDKLNQTSQLPVGFRFASPNLQEAIALILVWSKIVIKHNNYRKSRLGEAFLRF